MKRLSLALSVAAAASVVAIPASAAKYDLRKPTASVVTEGIIVACTFKAEPDVISIIVTQLGASGVKTDRVKLDRGFCGSFLKAATTSAPRFVKAVSERVRLAGTRPGNDPAVISAKTGTKTGVTTSEGSSESLVTSIEAITGKDGAITVSEKVAVR